MDLLNFRQTNDKSAAVFLFLSFFLSLSGIIIVIFTRSEK